MEASTGGGREASTATGTPKKKDREHYQNPDREIDQQHLADLLRESANLVERGEFGFILYEALQDFRVYYKQKYPKTGKKKKTKREKSERATDFERTADSIPVTSEASEKPASASSVILEDLKQSEDKDLKDSEDNAVTSTDEEEKKLEPDGDTNYTQETSVRSVGTSESHTDEPEADVDSNLDASMKSESNSAKVEETITPSSSEEASDINETKASIPVAVPVGLYKANVYGAPTQKPTAPVESAVPMPSAEQEQNSTGTPNTIRSPFRSPSTPQIQNRTGGFGKKFKLGATLQNVKKSALNVKKAAKNVTENITKNIDKKHHGPNRTNSGAREDLEFFAEAGVTMAVSSGRRTTADADSEVKKEFVGSSESKSRVTRGVAGATVAAGSRSRASEDAEEISDKFENGENNNQFSHDNHGRPDSDRSPVRPVSDRNLHPVVPPPAPKPVGHHHPPVYKSYSGETSDNADSYDSGGERIRANSEASASFELPADPTIMESDTKPRFQRPSNKNSPLVVSGWIEQFRRSKMRHVWKEVLLSLVEGRKPGEVTTLWIQREIVNPSGQKELEALQRIPLKILEEVSFTEHSTDYQFRLKVYNGTEDFVFRCNESANDALRWVQIIKKHEQLAKRTMDNGEKKPSLESSNPFEEQQQTPSMEGMAIRDLRAICHGAGVNTAGMERVELENAAEEVQRRGTYFDQRGVATGSSTPHVSHYNNDPSAQQHTPQLKQQQQQQQQYPHANQVNGDAGHSRHSRNPPPAATESAPPQQEQQQRIGIKELRSVCHGAGINTVGMERRELEAAAKEVQSRGTYFNPPIGMQAPNEDDAARARQAELRRQQEQQQKHEEMMRLKAVERHRQEVEEARKRAVFVEQEARRRAAEEEARRRAIEEEQRRRAAEEEARRRAAAEEQLRRQQEAQAAQTRYAQQQAAWQQQQQAEEQRRRAAEQQAAAERRRRDEALRKEHEWATPAPGAHPQQQQPHQYHQQQRQQGYPQQQWQQSQQQQQQRPAPQQHHQQQPRHHTAPPPQQRQQAPPPPQQQQRQHSGADNKYAQMANQSGDNGQAATTKIKHSILIQWALQPPQLQMLRPIAALVTTIHTVFPPALGVSGHDYFIKWKPITREDVAGVNNLPEESKLKKSVRKIRFFLHPDKLPHDLNEEQKFTVKMLWDITNDSWEEYQKRKEDLDWVN
jgi:hypothetical protein